MSDVETSGTSSKTEAAPSALTAAAQALAGNADAVEVVDLALDETPSIRPDQLQRRAQKALDRTMDASKLLEAALGKPVFVWRSYLNEKKPRLP
jgi:hypothetical protein